MKAITKTTTATTEKGTVINLIVTAQRGWEKVIEHLFNDGWESDIEKMQVIDTTVISAKINGKVYTGDFYIGMFVPVEYRIQGIYAVFANKIGLSEKVYNELNKVVVEATTEAETDQSWIDFLAKETILEKEETEYYANKKRVEDAMTLNGRTY